MTDFYYGLSTKLKAIAAEIDAALPAPTSVMPYPPVIIDIYGGNQLTDAGLLKASGVAAVIHKTTEGSDFVDKAYTSRRVQITQAGLLFGAYHFMRPGDGGQQAAFFLAEAQPFANTLMALDLEDHAVHAEDAEMFVWAIHAKTGRWPTVYTSASVISAINVPADSYLFKCPLWVASYRSGAPVLPAGWSTWRYWQYTNGEDGPEPHGAAGVSSCDRDAFNGNLSDLARAWAS